VRVGDCSSFTKPLVVLLAFERAWKCAAMWDSQIVFFQTGRKNVRWGKNLNLEAVGCVVDKRSPPNSLFENENLFVSPKIVYGNGLYALLITFRLRNVGLSERLPVHRNQSLLNERTFLKALSALCFLSHCWHTLFFSYCH